MPLAVVGEKLRRAQRKFQHFISVFFPAPFRRVLINAEYLPAGNNEMTRSTFIHFCLLFGGIAASAKSMRGVDPERILLSFYMCDEEKPSLNDCPIQDLDCIENMYKRLNHTSRSEVTVFVHGYGESRTDPGVQEFLSACCTRNTTIVVYLDWLESSQGDLVTVSNRVPSVGRLAASTFDRLNNKGYDIARWHIVGFSMGAHVAACVGIHASFTFSHITALDPAGPYIYTSFYMGCRMQPDVAFFTDAFYTDSGAMSTSRKVATVNIYANVGIPPQPGCCSAPDVHGCSHIKALEWYTEAMNDGLKYPATKCEDCLMFYIGYCDGNDEIYLGPMTNKSAKGTYCFSTE